MSSEFAIQALRDAGASVLDTPAGVIVVIPKRGANPDELLPLAAAAQVAATSVRVLRDAIRDGDLAAVGRQRDRAVRRRELEKWIESRACALTKVPDDLATKIERKLARKAAGK